MNGSAQHCKNHNSRRKQDHKRGLEKKPTKTYRDNLANSTQTRTTELPSLEKILSKTFLKQKTKKSTIQTSDQTLSKPLEEWKHRSSWFRKKWNTFYSNKNKALIIINDENSNIKIYQQIRNSRRR